MPPHVLMNFRGFPPGCGDSVADFWGWDAHEARLRCPDDVSGDTMHHCSSWRKKDQLAVTCYFISLLMCSTRPLLKTSHTKSPTHNEPRYVQSQIHIIKYINDALNTKQPMKHTTHKRTQRSQSVTDNGQYQWKYAYQLQQSDKAHHTKHTPLCTINLH